MWTPHMHWCVYTKYCPLCTHTFQRSMVAGVLCNSWVISTCIHKAGRHGGAVSAYNTKHALDRAEWQLKTFQSHCSCGSIDCWPVLCSASVSVLATWLNINLLTKGTGISIMVLLINKAQYRQQRECSGAPLTLQCINCGRYIYVYVKNHNSLGCERPLGLDINSHSVHVHETCCESPANAWNIIFDLYPCPFISLCTACPGIPDLTAVHCPPHSP